MDFFLILIMSIVATSIIAHLRIQSYLIAAITALFLGPLIVCVEIYIVSGLDSEVAMWLPNIFIFTTLFFSPAPFVLGLGVRLARRHFRESNGNCIQCGNKLHEDITIGCTQCGWKQECIRKGLCPICTYDLRSNFSAGCPECGWRRGAATEKEAREIGTM